MIALLNRIIFWSALIAFLPLIALADGKINEIYLSDEPLLSADKGSETHGLFPDFIKLVAAELDQDIRFQRMPWKRAQLVVSKGQNLGIGLITRTPPRETKFTWITALFPLRVIYLTTPDGPRISSIEDARMHRIGVKGGSVSTFIAKRHGIPKENLTVGTSQKNLLKMLDAGRVDSVLIWDVIAHRVLKDLEKAPTVIEGYSENLGELYLAASPDVDEAEIIRWRKAANAVIIRGELKKLMIQYLGREIS